MIKLIQKMKINRNLAILIVFLAFLATLFLGRQIFFPPQERLWVVNTVPSPGQNNVSLNQEIVLEFNQAVNSQDLVFSFFPEFLFEIKSENQKIIIKPKESLLPKTQYRLEFNQAVNPQDITISFLPEFPFEIKSENQKIIIKPKESLLPKTQYRLELKDKAESLIFSLVFETTAEEIGPTPLPLSPSPEATASGKGDPNAREEMAKKLYQDYPLYNFVPYRTTTWYTDYAAPKKLLVIYKKGEDLPTIQEEVFAWIRENKVDPKTHLYVWEEREVLP